MKKAIMRKAQSLLLVIALLLTMMPAKPLVRAAESLSTAVKSPFVKDQTVNALVSDGTSTTTFTSTSYRIPAMVTLKDGTIVAAADIRWNTTYDGGGLDTLVARSADGGVSWEYTLANYLGDNGNAYNGSDSTSFIDPSLTVAADGQTVYMLCDLYPYGVALNGSGNSAPVVTAGFTDAGYLKLDKNNSSTYSYYLKDGKIYSTSGKQENGYTVDDYFNLYRNGTKISNLFFEDSLYKVVRTGYLYLTKSTDGGKTWSAPTLLNLKTASEQVCLVGPGRGITTKDGTMVFPVYSYNGSTDSQRLGFVYSTDNGSTWQRTNSSISWSSEAAVVEVGTGTLRFFYRNGSGTGTLRYVDYNLNTKSWGTAVNTGIAINANTQLSAITYSKTADNGKQVILVSCPTGPYAGGSTNNDGSCRINGRIFAGVVNADGTMTWEEAVNVTGTSSAQLSSANYTDAQGFFAYSCLTERTDGSIAILYENNQYGWGAGDNKYYTITMKAYAASSLGLTFDDGTAPDTPPADGSKVTVPLELGETSAPFTVSADEVIGTAGTFTTPDGAVSYTVTHNASAGKYAPDSDGIDSGSKYLITLGQNAVVYTSSSSVNDWGVNSLPIKSVNVGGTADLSDYLWTITETTGGYYIQNPAGKYMTIQTSYSLTGNYTVTLSSTPFVCDIQQSGNGYRIFANGSYIGLNDAGGAKQTALGWDDQNNTVWTLYKQQDQNGTEVTFSGLGITSGTDVTLGTKTYTVVVEAKEAELDTFLQLNSSQTLDAVAALGLSGDAYTATYVKTADANGALTLSGNVISSGDVAGDATVVATVTNTTGGTVGTVTYTITVANVAITDVQRIYVPVNGTASISGLTGDYYEGLLDTDIATYSVTGDTVTFTGVAEGKTSLVVGSVRIDVYTVPQNTDTDSKNTRKYIYINVEEIEHCTVYYSINGSDLIEITEKGVLIDQVYTDGMALMLFTAPEKGYALTEMKGSNIYTDGSSNPKPMDGTFYTLRNGKNAAGEVDVTLGDAWPYDANGNYKSHGWQWMLREGNITKARLLEIMETAAELGCDGASVITRNKTTNTTANTEADMDWEDVAVNFSFKAEELPTFEKTILKVNGQNYNENVVFEFGDKITYQFTITSYSSNIQYTNIRIQDAFIGFDSGTSIPDNKLDKAGSYTYTADYTVNQNDIDKYINGKFLNRAELTYNYTSTYSNGVYESAASASVSCDISGLAYYVWGDDVPAAITGNAATYPLPTQSVVTYGTTFKVASYAGLREYEATENGVAVGKWTFSHWESNGRRYTGGENATMVDRGSMEFVGIWEYTPYPTYTVTYQWSGAPATGVSLPTDSGAYYAGQTYTVDGTYKAGDIYTLGGVTYTFGGWKLDGVLLTGQQEMGSENVVLAGVWTSQQNYTSLTIQKSGCETVDPNQTFLFNITGEGINLKVSVHGNGQVVVDGLKVNGTYTVTEISEWSWRYVYIGYTTALTSERVDSGARITLGQENNTITFRNQRWVEWWLDGDNWIDNLFNKQP